MPGTQETAAGTQARATQGEAPVTQETAKKPPAVEVCIECEEDIAGRVHKDPDGGSCCESCFNDQYRTCENCSNVIDKDDARDIPGGGWYCEACFDDSCGTCAHCENPAWNSDMTEAPDGDWYCEDCFNEQCATCSGCETVLWVGDARDYGDRNYCADCWSESFFTCPGCDEDHRTDFGHYDEGEGETYCSDCYEGHRVIHRYGYYPPFTFLPKKDRAGFFEGVELEVDKDGERTPVQESAPAEESAQAVTELSEYLYCKEYASLEHGYEIVSHPATLEYHEKKMPWGKVLDQVRSDGFLSHNCKSCGLHVHVPRRWFSDVDLVKLAAFVHMHRLEHIKLSRRENQYAKYKAMGKGTLRAAILTQDRSEAVNFTNPRTVEFRMFKGTLKLSTLFATLEYVDAVSHWIKTVSIATIIKGHLSWGRFLGYVQNDRKTYRNLIKYMADRGITGRESGQCVS